ncbi:MAG: response regulator transcription factor, partial [Lachnospiraceae bacterium]|nr:response regulator transcription factor [Lachnospiraceae bacterium]
MDMVMAINMGGDEFTAKPFDIDVLSAKISAMLRRSYDYAGNMSVLEHKGAFLNVENAVLTYQENTIGLTKNEHRILTLLMKNKGRIVSRERLMDALWEMDCYVDDNALTVNIGRLRKKLEAGGLTDFIRTKFGEGYYIGGDHDEE